MLEIPINERSKQQLSSMPLRRFWSDQGDESTRAQQLLQKFGIGVITIEYKPSRSHYGPLLITPSGAFSGIETIRHYCSVLFDVENRMQTIASSR